MKKNTAGFSLLTLALIGGGIALILFLGTFIVFSSAKTPHPKRNLVIPVPAIPAKKPLPTPPVKVRALRPSATPNASEQPDSDLSEEEISLPETATPGALPPTSP